MKKLAKITAISTLIVLCLCGLTLRQAQDTAFAGALPDTGQTKCYNDTAEITCPAPGEDFYGQDAQYATNPRSYTKLDAGGNDLPDSAASWTMVRDNVTGLIWEVKTDDGAVHDKDNTYTWHDSNPETNGGDAGTPGDGTDTEDFINALNTENFGGYSDWRLPTLKELASIANLGTHFPAIDTEYFPNAQSLAYWSSSTYANSTDNAWCMYFSYGKNNYIYKRGTYCVRAVRGQSGHFGSLIINGDGTVTDTETGLMWQQQGSDSGMNWKDALAYCESLNLADYNDWRLPNIEELRSIVDYGKYNLATPTEYFPNTQSSYWSSSTDAHATDIAWYIFFNKGFADNYYDKLYIHHVRAVRIVQTESFDDLVISVTPAVGGTVAGTGISCPGDCDESYDSGTAVQLTATSADCYDFTGWSGDCSGTSSTCTLTMDDDKSLTANFAIKTHSLTITANNGSVTKSPSASSYDCGTEVSLTATPNTGWHFVRWEGDASSTSASASVTMTADRSVTAVFEEDIPDTYTLTKTVSPSSGGAISASPDKSVYTDGESVTLTATPKACYDFTGWSGACSGTSPACTLTVDADKSVTANFAVKTHSVNITANNGSVTKSPNQSSYDCGTTVLLTAEPDDCYDFIGWSGACSGTNSTCSLTTDADKSVIANFAVRKYSLGITANNGSVTKSPNQSSYDCGTTVLLTATPNSGYNFDHWEGDATGIQTTASITMTEEMNVTAVFVSGSYTISGYVRNSENQGVSGVTLTFSNDGGSATTDSSGFYTRSVSSGWSGTVTPDKTCHTFAPANTPYSNISSSQSEQNYTATTETYTISGYVRDSSTNSGVSGITLNFSNSGGSTTTDSSGFYSHSVDCGWSGTATPSVSAYTVSPSNLSYGSVTSDMSEQNYTATQQAVPKISVNPESLTFFQSQFKKKRTDIFPKPENNKVRQNTEPENLFRTVSQRNVRLSERQSDLLFSYESLETTEDSKIVQVNTDLLKTEDLLNLNLSDDATYPIFRTRTEERHAGDFTWYGETENEPFGNAIFVVQNKEVTGTIRTGDGATYALRPISDGLHALIRQNPDGFPPEHPPEYAEGMIPEPSPVSEKRHSARSDDGSVITVLVAYTPAAANSASNINAIAQLAVDEANQSYQNSGISPRLELVHTYQVNYTESGDFGTDLSRFSGTGDGYMDEVHDLRDSHAADIAMLLINHTQYCGVAYLNLPLNPAYGFGVVYWDCATGYYSFAHEIGHIQNARHNPEVDSSTYPHPYGHAYLNAPRGWRTIMGYNNSACPGGFCQRVQYWSNPDVKYGGEVTGTASTHDNARVLDETSVAVANFRVSESGTTLTIQNIGGAALTINGVIKDQNWLSVSGYPNTPFTISSGGSQTVTVEVNWGSLGSSQQDGSVTINSDDPDTPSLIVPVTVIPVSGDEIAVLSVIPDYRNIATSGGTGTFIADNIGTGSISWTAKTDDSWLTITDGNSGNGSGTVTFDCEANHTSEARTGNITITASAAENSPRTVEIIQSVTGDIDYSGTVDLSDVILALKISAGVEGIRIMSDSESGYASLGVDVNGDNQIGLEEAVYALEVVAEMRK